MTTPAKVHKGTAAFFDLDGTLVPEPSLERRLFAALRRAGAVPLLNYLRWSAETLRLLPKGIAVVQQRNKRYLAGLSGELALRHFESIVFFEEGIARVVWHALQGHAVVLVSGTLEPLAAMAAMALECELEARGVQARVWQLATRLREVSGRWTGTISGEAMFGKAKAGAAKRLAEAQGWDPRVSHAYGNTLLDAQLLCSVGNAHVVNPGKQLAALANEKDWPIWHWHVERQVVAAPEADSASGIQHSEGRA